MSFEKENFLRTKLIRYLQQLDPATPPRWGKMSVQQMIEHLGGHAIRNASGRLTFDTIVTPHEKLERMREFMMSDKPFKENTKNPLLDEEPQPLRYKTVQAAIGALQLELIYFFEAFHCLQSEGCRCIIKPKHIGAEIHYHFPHYRVPVWHLGK